MPNLTGDQRPLVAVAHSLGGYLAITQQALFSSYTALAVLGCTNQHVAPLNLDSALIARSSTPEGRAALAAEILCALPQPYSTVRASTCGTAMTPGIVAEHAARIDVPVLIAFGAVDVSPDPRAEARLYSSCPDITTVILAGSAHCHNMSSNRHRLWRRRLAWTETVAATPRDCR